jgi:hypothetical protein
LYEQFRLFYSYITDCTLTKHSFGNTFIEAWDKAATSANIKARFRAPCICLFKATIVPDELFAPNHTTHIEDALVFNVVTLTKKPVTVLLAQKKTQKVSPVHGTTG